MALHRNGSQLEGCGGWNPSLSSAYHALLFPANDVEPPSAGQPLSKPAHGVVLLSICFLESLLMFQRASFRPATLGLVE